MPEPSRRQSNGPRRRTPQNFTGGGSGCSNEYRILVLFATAGTFDLPVTISGVEEDITINWNAKPEDDLAAGGSTAQYLQEALETHSNAGDVSITAGGPGGTLASQELWFTVTGATVAIGDADMTNLTGFNTHVLVRECCN